MSMNPSRTFGSAVLPQLWDSLWIYFLAPPLGMLAAAAAYLRLKHAVGCAKLHHQNKLRCIFCEYHVALETKIVAADVRRRTPATEHLINTSLHRGGTARRWLLNRFSGFLLFAGLFLTFFHAVNAQNTLLT